MIHRTPSPLLQHPYPSFGTKALATLRGGGLVLMPTANLWQVVAHCGHQQAVHRLLDLCPSAREHRPELIFPDIDSLRAWCPRIDPTLDTLLLYHRRPLTLSVPAGSRVPLSLLNEGGEVNVRIASDSGCYRLCEDLEGPLVACLAMGSTQAELPSSFGKIRCDVLRGVDHIVGRRQKDNLGDQATVTVRINERNEIEFLRT